VSDVRRRSGRRPSSQTAYQLRKLSLDADLLERLEGTPEPWASLRPALEALRDEELAAAPTL